MQQALHGVQPLLPIAEHLLDPAIDLVQRTGIDGENVVTPFPVPLDHAARFLDRQSGPAVLVGHSYGGAVITEAGNNVHVASLVYVAAFAPDDGEKPGPLLGSIAPTADGYLLVDQAKFPADFAADLPPAEAQFMAISQVPINGSILGTPITAPAWKTKPSYGIVATQDRMINPNLERSMYKRAGAKVTEIKSSHAVYVSRPNDVARLIERAAEASTQ